MCSSDLLALLAAAITAVVILQQGRGADIGAAFGSGSANTIFGSSGIASPLAKLTWGLAGLFVVLCLSLAYLAKHRADQSVAIAPHVPATETPSVPSRRSNSDAPVVPSAPGPAGSPAQGAPQRAPAPAPAGDGRAHV